MTSAEPRTRTWYPSAARGSRVEPTVPELLAMADGTRQDWRPVEPSTRDLAVLEQETSKLLAEYAAFAHQEIEQAERTLRHTFWPPKRRRLRHEIDERWDAIGHLCVGA